MQERRAESMEQEEAALIARLRQMQELQIEAFKELEGALDQDEELL